MGFASFLITHYLNCIEEKKRKKKKKGGSGILLLHVLNIIELICLGIVLISA
jgi:hypothetical protein